jgi:hypothetical protein
LRCARFVAALAVMAPSGTAAQASPPAAQNPSPMVESTRRHERLAVLKWGPRGTQQLSEARSGRFALLGFAGNSAPDHVDLLHAMPEFLARLLAR